MPLTWKYLVNKSFYSTYYIATIFNTTTRIIILALDQKEKVIYSRILILLYLFLIIMFLTFLMQIST